MTTCLFVFWMYGLSLQPTAQHQGAFEAPSTPTLLAQNNEGTPPAQAGDQKVGQIKLVGKYKSQQLKDGDKTANYFKLGKGEQIVLKVVGPAPLILRMHGNHKKAIKLQLSLDDRNKQEQLLAFPKTDAWKTIYTQVPEGLHFLTMKVPGALFIRPVKVSREPEATETVVSWNTESKPAEPAQTPETVAAKAPAPAPTAPAASGEVPANAGTISMIGKYTTMALKDGENAVNYFKLGKGQKIALRVVGPAPVVLKMHGIHKNAIKLLLTLDDKEIQEQAIAFPKTEAWKTIYTQIPAGEHTLSMTVPGNLFVRPLSVKREPEASEKLVAWGAPADAQPPAAVAKAAPATPPTPALSIPALPANAGIISMIGTYNTQALKQNGMAVNYFKLGKGQTIALKVIGPTPVQFKMHGAHKKPIKLELTLDDKEKQKQALAFPKKDAWKTIYTQIPAGEHTLAMSIPGNLFVRPESVQREPEASEQVVAWAAPAGEPASPPAAVAATTPAPPAPPASVEMPMLPASSPSAPQVVALVTPTAPEIAKAPEPPAEVKPKMIQGEQVALSGAVPAAKLKIVHRTQVKEYFQLAAVEYLLDGKPIVQKAGAAELAGEITLFDEGVEPGTHMLSVKMVYQGKSRGIFTYTEGYRYVTSTEFQVLIPHEKTLQVQVQAGERTGFTLLMEQRPEIRYTTELAANP